MQEALRLFKVATMDAARSGINQQINLTTQMANEVKVCRVNFSCKNKDKILFTLLFFFFLLSVVANRSSSLKQQAETQIKRRIGIGNHISERKLIDEFTRMGMNESIVSWNLTISDLNLNFPLQLAYYMCNG